MLTKIILFTTKYCNKLQTYFILAFAEKHNMKVNFQSFFLPMCIICCTFVGEIERYLAI